MKVNVIFLLLLMIKAFAPLAANAQSAIHSLPLHHLPGVGNTSEIRIECPARVSAGVLNVPQGWFQLTAREHLFNSLVIRNSPANKKISIICQYGKQDDHAMAREVSSIYQCSEVTRRTVACKTRIHIKEK
jgi:hypothetical protein